MSTSEMATVLAWNDALSEKNLGTLVDLSSDDIEIGGLDEPFTIPWAFEGDVPVPFDIFDALDQNPVKAFEFTINGTSYKALPVKATVEPETSDKQTYSLLSAPANDLTPLIDFYE